MLTQIALFLTLATAPELLPPSALVPVAGPLSVYAPHEAQVMACVAYLETGDETMIAVEISDDGEVGTLECEDYSEAMPIVARRARERAFRAWYAKASKRLGLSADPDDKRHGYDYRLFFDMMRAGKAKDIKRGETFPEFFLHSTQEAMRRAFGEKLARAGR